MGILIDEILTSVDSYNNTTPDYSKYLGRKHSQDLHLWWHMTGWVKRRYEKDNPNHVWHFFYKALHKNPPASEKIVNFTRTYTSANWQLWAS